MMISSLKKNLYDEPVNSISIFSKKFYNHLVTYNTNRRLA
jgi:hypothetical protein